MLPGDASAVVHLAAEVEIDQATTLSLACGAVVAAVVAVGWAWT
jgi:hypothetical protein